MRFRSEDRGLPIQLWKIGELGHADIDIPPSNFGVWVGRSPTALEGPKPGALVFGKLS